MSSCLRNPPSLAGKKTGAWAGCLVGEEAGSEGAEQGKWTKNRRYFNQNSIGFGKMPYSNGYSVG